MSKKKTKKFVELDQLGSNNNPILEEIKSHGHFPPTEMPIGWDGDGFQRVFPTKNLPFQDIAEVKYDDKSACKSRLIWGDNLAVMRSLPDECIDLIYIDPPFFSGRDYNLIFQDEDEERTFRDIWDGGLETYLAWMNARLWEMRRLLSKNGSIFVHLDWHAIHYVKVEMDKIFGYDNFLNEIIWSYKSGGRAKKFFPRKHDTILWYSKNPRKWTFNIDKIGVPRNQCQDCGSELEKWNNMKKQVDEEGRVYRSIKSNGKVYKYYDDEPTTPADVWLGINHLQQKDPERIGYPTQKPETLLQRIIESASNPGDMVADFFSGGGSTAYTAQKLARKWISCDVSRVAVQVASDRLANLGSDTGIEIPREQNLKPR